MKRPGRYAAAAVLLAAIGSARIVSTYRVFNHTIDEPDTLAAGMEYLTTGKYRYEDTHPPLGRVFSAIGPYLSGERFHSGPNSYFEGYRILGWDAHYDRVLALARMGILPFFWIGCLVVYLWARRIRGPAAGALAVLVYSTIPPVLAHAGLATTDLAVGVMTPAAALAAVCWGERPDRRRSVVFGSLMALAWVSKFSAILYVPAGCLAMWAWRRGAVERRHWKGLALALATAALVVWAVYGFSFARVEFLHMRLPAPRFWSGIHSVYVHNQVGHPAYLLGQRSSHGFWYYFPVVLFIKTPLALLILAVWAGIARRDSTGGKTAGGAVGVGSGSPTDDGTDRTGGKTAGSTVGVGSGSPGDLVAGIAFAAGVLAVAMTGHIDLGVRYILPVYAGLAVAAGCLAATVRGAPARVAVAVLLAWQVLSGALQHPDYLAYTNEIAGSHPEHWVADSDLDWGQDMRRLGDFLARRGVTQLTFAPFNRTYLWAGHPLPPLESGDTDHPSPGWNAVSITIWKVFGYPKWADTAPPPERRIGRSILLWHFQ